MEGLPILTAITAEDGTETSTGFPAQNLLNFEEKNTEFGTNQVRGQQSM